MMVLPENQSSRSDFDAESADLKRQIAQAAVFEISNVAEYFYNGTVQEKWHLFRDFPRPMPPFRTMWAEWSMPSTMITKGQILKHMDLPLREYFHKVGCLFRTMPVEESEVDWSATEPAFKSLVSVIVFFQNPNKIPVVCAGMMFGMDDHWNPVPSAINKGMRFNVPGLKGSLQAKCNDIETVRDACGIAHQIFYPAMLALSLLNCRNITTKEIRTPEALVRSHRRKGRDITPSHLVIEIQPMIQKIKGSTGASGYHRDAAPIVRGHFKDFSRGAGLFGKYKGMYWWDQRVTGIAPSDVQYRLKNSAAELDEEWNPRMIN